MTRSTPKLGDNMRALVAQAEARRSPAFPVVPEGDPHMARPLNTPPVEALIDDQPPAAMTLCERATFAASAVFALGAWWLLIEVIS